MESRDRSPDVEPGSPTGAPGGDPTISSGPERAAALWSAALVSGLAAGIAAWLIGEATHEFFKPVLVETTIMGRTAGGRRWRRATRRP